MPNPGAFSMTNRRSRSSRCPASNRCNGQCCRHAFRKEPEISVRSYKNTINGAETNVLEIAPRRWGSPASRLAEILRTGHPDKDGKPRVDVPDEDCRRVYLWMDLNIPYYGTSSSDHKEQLGSRRMMPLDLDKTLSEVASRRCNECHKPGVPRKFYTRVMNPEKNNFLLAPLAKNAGGYGLCHPRNAADGPGVLSAGTKSICPRSTAEPL